MADVEVQLILRRSEVPLGRQHQAFLVSAHIFDLALNQNAYRALTRLRYFVGQTAKLHRDVVNNPGRICRPNRRHIYANLECKPTVHDLGVDV